MNKNDMSYCFIFFKYMPLANIYVGGAGAVILNSNFFVHFQEGVVNKNYSSQCSSF